ncbi:unnamed protein product [Lactuca virosa]|uniref:Uncharacterized protein n=1 Tax=Lactuca virosa TaxID=75947 RepID=A0AAU9L9E2_9ASTR|nr:unnamed protein product [Lactuca virosa]
MIKTSIIFLNVCDMRKCVFCREETVVALVKYGAYVGVFDDPTPMNPALSRFRHIFVGIKFESIIKKWCGRKQKYVGVEKALARVYSCGEVGGGKDRYTVDDIDEIRKEWSSFVATFIFR